MIKEQPLQRARLKATQTKGAPYPRVPPGKKGDRQPRPKFPVKVTGKPSRLREPSPGSQAAKAGGKDPRGNDNPVRFHDYHRSTALTKSLTNAADMSGADSEGDVVMMSGNWYCDVSKRRRRDLEPARPDDDLPGGPRRRLLLRPDRDLRAEHRPLRLAAPVRKGRGPGRARSGSRRPRRRP